MSNALLVTPSYISSFGSNGIGNILRATSISAPASTAWATANLGVFTPFYVLGLFRFTTFTWRNGATISGNVEVGVYSSDGRKIRSTGVVPQAAGANAHQSVTVPSTALGVGMFYFGTVFSSNTATIFGQSTANAGLAAMMGVFNQASALPLPEQFIISDPASVVVPQIVIN